MELISQSVSQSVNLLVSVSVNQFAYQSVVTESLTFMSVIVTVIQC